MTNSRWQINRVGLVDFWYYDEEEFQFLDGRMLLRGANGSGKSVTMQSFIPLLLDGNMRPERLDPFGSRARKMENYLLEEGDEQEERTAYLYMELKREESDTYLSMGIGMRARRNKKMDSWYFCITDGRRIGKGIFLYKDLKNKIACTKQELKNRIGEGGKVMETQGEYAQCVNRYLFGFETQEEYREMLELLIQLRTPKLSKEFKPTVINDILSSSLQTLSEDDLRPMSEAIENMDELRTNLDGLKERLAAAKQIERVYNQYNEILLYNKAAFYTENVKECAELERKEEEQKQLLQEKRQKLQEEEEHYHQLVREEEVLRKEKDSLAGSDAAKLKEQELTLSRETEEQERLSEQKQAQEEDKKDRKLEAEDKKQKQSEENDRIWEEIEEKLTAMEEIMEEIPFDEAAFFIREIKDAKDEVHSFQIHNQLLTEYRRKVEAGRQILEEERIRQQQHDHCLWELDQYYEKQKTAERELLQRDNLLHEIKGEWTEKLYQWEKENQELHLSPETLSEMVRLIDEYQMGSDFSEVKDLAKSAYFEKEQEISRETLLVTAKIEELQNQQKALRTELADWKAQKDPEPEQPEEVQKNRAILKQKKIPYIPFYKAVDFEKHLTPKQMSCLEEALLHMGLLDALIVPAEYREQIQTLREGTCDKYLFSDVARVKENLNQWLSVDHGEDDILYYQEVFHILSSIGIDGGLTWIRENGTYGIGVLEGTITGAYEAKYIGSSAREAFRQKKILELEAALRELEETLTNWKHCLEILQARIRSLQEEWKQFPSEEDLKVAAKEYAQKAYDLEMLREQLKKQQEKTEEERKKLVAVRLKVTEICAGTYLTPRLDIFQHALQALTEYKEILMDVKGLHSDYLNGLSYVQSQESYLEEIEEDLDNIRYEAVRIQRKLRELQARLTSVREQLRLTDYDQIRERLDHCIRRLSLLPGEREASIGKQSSREKEIENFLEKQKEQEAHFARIKARKIWAQQAFQEENNLNYVEKALPFKALPVEKLAEKLCSVLSGKGGLRRQNDLQGNLQEVFHQNLGSLTNYQLTIVPLFEESDNSDEAAFASVGNRKRLDISAKYRSAQISFRELLQKLIEDAEELERLLSDKDRELFEDILANTISKKIRGKIHSSKRWVEKMNDLMESMQTSSGLKLSLRWKHKRAEKEEQLDTGELVALLQKDVEIMKEEEVEKVSSHFRSKIAEAQKIAKDMGSVVSFHAIIREVLDYRKWFEFQLECQKTGEKKKELTDRVFFTFSGGEKAMAMYVPLFSAVVAKYDGARADAPRLISLDEAFAGVDQTNIRDMFRLMVEFEFNFIINSQILWGDCDTVPALAIYQLIRPQNAKFVSVIRYKWNGSTRSLWEKEEISDEE